MAEEESKAQIEAQKEENRKIREEVNVAEAEALTDWLRQANKELHLLTNDLFNLQKDSSVRDRLPEIRRLTKKINKAVKKIERLQERYLVVTVYK